ncbi:MAG TPA: hypothetical protein VH477_02430, partial [Bryobacteraceae bacterium]
MPQGNQPDLGINSWLEDELYHQYQFDRRSLDAGWNELFADHGQNGGSATNGDSAGTATAVAEPPQPPPPVEEPSQPEPPRQEPPAPAPQPQENAPSTPVSAPAKV